MSIPFDISIEPKDVSAALEIHTKETDFFLCRKRLVPPDLILGLLVVLIQTGDVWKAARAADLVVHEPIEAYENGRLTSAQNDLDSPVIREYWLSKASQGCIAALLGINRERT